MNLWTLLDSFLWATGVTTWIVIAVLTFMLATGRLVFYNEGDDADET